MSSASSAFPKKVIIIGPAHPLRGGLATFNERLARQFMQEGADTTIFTFSLQYPGFLFPGTTQYSDAAAPADLDIKVRINSMLPTNWISVGEATQKTAARYYCCTVLVTGNGALPGNNITHS